MKVLVIGVSAVLLAGCVKPLTNDQCLRQEVFFQCMKALPAGPEKTMYNDWDEVVSTCSDTAYRLSIRNSDYIKPECTLK